MVEEVGGEIVVVVVVRPDLEVECNVVVVTLWVALLPTTNPRLLRPAIMKESITHLYYRQ